MRALDTLERVSLLLVLCGIATIYAASVVYAPAPVSLAAVDESRIGDTVRVEANVTSHRRSDATQFLTLRQENERMTAVYFGNREIDVIPHQVHRIDGRIDVYQGELELIIRDVSPITAGSTPS